MSDTKAPNDIVFWQYPFSPYARRIIWYLALRKIPHAQCIQPPMLPRPDLEALGVRYRRIPILSIGRDVYCDTRLILQVLEKRFPASAEHPGLSPEGLEGITALLSKFTIDSGVFARASQMIPPDGPVLKNPAFLKDRESFMGRSWQKEDIIKQRPEAMVHLREAFAIIEALLADGRQWIAGTEKPTMADIEAVWPFSWLMDLNLPAEHFSDKHYPKTYAWLKRWKQATKDASAAAPKPVTLKGPEALQAIMCADFNDKQPRVDESDPLGLKAGSMVEVFPIDSGFTHKDAGSLVALNEMEVAVAVKSKNGGKEIRVHAPRWGFRVKAVEGAKL
ncbi:hypothetical protein MBLNU230_g6800t1 [Neophaeotheca triangularis]